MTTEACQPMEADVARILLHAHEIDARTRQLAREIGAIYNGDEAGPPVTIGDATGAQSMDESLEFD